MSVFRNGSKEFENLAFVYATCALPKEVIPLDDYTGICSFTVMLPLPTEGFKGFGMSPTVFQSLLWSEMQRLLPSIQTKLESMCPKPLNGSVRLLGMDHEVHEWP